MLHKFLFSFRILTVIAVAPAGERDGRTEGPTVTASDLQKGVQCAFSGAFGAYLTAAKVRATKPASTEPPSRLLIMSFNTFGHLFRFTSFGESHGAAIGCVVDGCPPRIPLSVEDIQRELDRRRPGQSRFTT